MKGMWGFNVGGLGSYAHTHGHGLSPAPHFRKIWMEGGEMREGGGGGG